MGIYGAISVVVICVSVFLLKDVFVRFFKHTGVLDREVSDLSVEERYGEYPHSYVSSDVNRYGRWFIKYTNNKASTIVGTLNTVLLNDPLLTVESYREIG